MTNLATSFRRLRALAIVEKMGYVPFTTKATYLRSRLCSEQASFQDKPTDPFIIKIETNEGEWIRVWSDNYSQIQIGDTLDEIMMFNTNLFINPDRFVICLNEENFDSLVTFQEKNIFKRPVINNIDDRYDLGDLVFIVSDLGILFSMYQRMMKKLTVDNCIAIKGLNRWERGALY